LSANFVYNTFSGSLGFGYSATQYYSAGFPSSLSLTLVSGNGIMQDIQIQYGWTQSISLTYQIAIVEAVTFSGQQVLKLGIYPSSIVPFALTNVTITTKGTTAGIIRTNSPANITGLGGTANQDSFIADVGNVNSGNPITLNTGDTLQVLISFTIATPYNSTAQQYFTDNINGVSYVVLPLQWSKLARIDIRALKTVRQGGAAGLLGSAAVTTVQGSSVASVTINSPGQAANVILSPNTQSQLKAQGAIAVVTANANNKTTITFYQAPVNTADVLLPNSSAISQNGGAQVNVANLTPKTVTLANAAITAFVTRLRVRVLWPSRDQRRQESLLAQYAVMDPTRLRTESKKQCSALDATHNTKFHRWLEMDILSILAIVAPETCRVFKELDIKKANEKELMIISMAMLHEEQRRISKLLETAEELQVQNGLKLDQLMRR
jgi:hypothetical protein